MDIYDIERQLEIAERNTKIMCILIGIFLLVVFIIYIMALIKINVYLPKIEELLKKIEKNTNLDVIEENGENEIKNEESKKIKEREENLEFIIRVITSIILITLIVLGLIVLIKDLI